MFQRLVTIRDLLPTFDVVFYLWQLASVEGRLFDTVSFLLPIIIEKSEHIFPEKDDGDEVACR